MSVWTCVRIKIRIFTLIVLVEKLLFYSEKGNTGFIINFSLNRIVLKN